MRYIKYTKNKICFASVFDIYLLHPPAATRLSKNPYATHTKHMAYINKIIYDVRETHTKALH
jgi:hypothetical protein